MSKDSKPKQTKKEHSSFTEKAPEPKIASKPSSNLHSDFKSVSAVSRHVRDLSDDDKIKFLFDDAILILSISNPPILPAVEVIVPDILTVPSDCK